MYPDLAFNFTEPELHLLKANDLVAGSIEAAIFIKAYYHEFTDTFLHIDYENLCKEIPQLAKIPKQDTLLATHKLAKNAKAGYVATLCGKRYVTQNCLRRREIKIKPPRMKFVYAIRLNHSQQAKVGYSCLSLDKRYPYLFGATVPEGLVQTVFSELAEDCNEREFTDNEIHRELKNLGAVPATFNGKETEWFYATDEQIKEAYAKVSGFSP